MKTPALRLSLVAVLVVTAAGASPASAAEKRKMPTPTQLTKKVDRALNSLQTLESTGNTTISEDGIQRLGTARMLLDVKQRLQVFESLERTMRDGAEQARTTSLEYRLGNGETWSIRDNSEASNRGCWRMYRSGIPTPRNQLAYNIGFNLRPHPRVRLKTYRRSGRGYFIKKEVVTKTGRVTQVDEWTIDGRMLPTRHKSTISYRASKTIVHDTRHRYGVKVSAPDTSTLQPRC